MPLGPGTKLGPYEIVGPLGVGGMGEVYRAKDGRLDRSVAIKVLPAQFSADLVRKQRFEREAKTISGLNHPHICVLYDVGCQDGTDYLVMECVEGETLAKRLEKGPLPLEQVLKYGGQIADALDKAHRSSVVHRDLKPGNIMLTPTGAKLLDFGLAKPAAPVLTGSTLTAATPLSPMTEEGTIVGTFQYMSPEQVEGKEVDGRSDIFSLGAVLYEMLTGQKAFEGKSQLSVASAILEKEPASISTVKPMTPPALDRAIKKCLAKAPDERWQSANDLASELKWIADFGPQASAASTARSGHRLTIERIVWGLALTAALVALAAALARWRQQQGAEVTRYTIDPPEQGKFLFGGIDEGPAVSPDGRQIAFIATVGGVKQVWVKPAESVRAQALPGTDNAVSAFWSPDSKNLAFETEGKLKRVSLSGGSPQTICDLPTTIRGGSWSRRDVILFGATPGPIYRVSASGGTPQVVTSLKRGDILHRWPFFLPDENHFLYLASQATTMQESSALFVGSLDGQADRMLFRANSAVAYANGYLLYLSGQLLMARAFDPEKLEFTGNALPVADGILLDPYFGATTFSVSQNGVLVFQQGKPYSGYALQVFDRSGKEIASLREAGVYFRPRFSPDGKQIAYGSLTLASAKADIFVWDITAGSTRRITFNSTYNRSPVWSPDGTRIAFVGREADRATVYTDTARRIGPEEELASLPDGYLTQWTPDGKYLIADDGGAGYERRFHIALVPADGHGPVKSLLEKPDASITSGLASPDGRWLAYVSTETGKSEVYLTSFPRPSGKLQVSIAGGGGPHWREDGKELFFMGSDSQVMAAELEETAGSLQVALLRPLFRANTLSSPNYDASANGTRFAVLSVTGEETAAPINVVVNWDAELKKE
jgi:Tol biopolymer transport system component